MWSLFSGMAEQPLERERLLPFSVIRIINQEEYFLGQFQLLVGCHLHAVMYSMTSGKFYAFLFTHANKKAYQHTQEDSPYSQALKLGL